eukprot:TRINITY_DN13033_c0_g1_i1.p1 TRINITY_DN13033_c0_g1~~TRINITY_DN13033_c0_g1_i1.p1  ORF type:complete len:132 (-),score=18.09 TRINITY_DN13033_c0_g1_i1:254-649(-)
MRARVAGSILSLLASGAAAFNVNSLAAAFNGGCPETQFEGQDLLGQHWRGVIPATSDGHGAAVTCHDGLVYNGPAITCNMVWTQVLTSKVQQFMFEQDPPSACGGCSRNGAQRSTRCARSPPWSLVVSLLA